MFRHIIRQGCLWMTIFAGAAGCGSSASEEVKSRESAFDSVKPSAEAAAAQTQTLLTADELREALGANENAQFERTGRKFSVALLTNSGAKTLEPLKGQPLKVVDISQTQITDLSPLSGMPIENIGLAETNVTDLSPLKGAPLRHIDGTRSQIADISALAGMNHLSHVYLEGALVSDLSPLQSAPLKVVWLNGCPVTDLSPLENQQLDELNLCDTPLKDLTTVKTMKLGTLWMRNTEVRDLQPIANHGLVSLDVQGSAVESLNALKEMVSLKRLNIADTSVVDLSPLATLSLERLIFTPSNIQKGMEVIRNMASLQAIDTSFDGVSRPLSPSEFWERYDSGEFKAETE